MTGRTCQGSFLSTSPPSSAQHTPNRHRASCQFNSLHSILGSSPHPFIPPRPTAMGCKISSRTTVFAGAHPHHPNTVLTLGSILTSPWLMVASAHITNEHLASTDGLWGVFSCCYKGLLADNFKETRCENVFTIST